MNRSIKLKFALSLHVVLTTSCGLNSDTANLTASEPQAAFKSEAIHESFKTISSSESFKTLLQKLSRSSFTNQAAYFHEVADNESFSIDGLSYGNAQSWLESHRAHLSKLDQKYNSIGSYWRAIGFDPSTISLEQFRRGLSSLSDSRGPSNKQNQSQHARLAILQAAEAARVVSLAFSSMSDSASNDAQTKNSLGLAVVITACADGSTNNKNCPKEKKHSCTSRKSLVYGAGHGIFKYEDGSKRLWATDEEDFQKCAANIASKWLGRDVSIEDAPDILEPKSVGDIYTIDNYDAMIHGCADYEASNQSIIGRQDSKQCFDDMKSSYKPEWADKKEIRVGDSNYQKPANQYSGQVKDYWGNSDHRLNNWATYDQTEGN